MSHKISLINETSFVALKNSCILDEGIRQTVMLPHSCKSGRCGECKTRVITGESSAVRTESALSASDVNAGYILTCCRIALSEMHLEIEDLPEFRLVSHRILPAKILSIEDLSSTVRQITLRLPPRADFNYLAGQYLSISNSAGIRRSYSVSHAPNSNNTLAFHVKKVTGGLMSEYWFERCRPNDLLRIEGPKGTFFLRNKNSKKLLILATGTGIAPALALLDEIQRRHDPSSIHLTPDVHLYWGNRNKADFYLNNFFPEEIKGSCNYIVSSASESEDRRYRRGYVQDIAAADIQEFNDFSVYACGSQKMVQDAQSKLIRLGLNPRRFFSDAFVASE